MNFEVNGVTIDEYSQTLLWLLRDADAQRCASQLVDEIDLDTTQKVRHRIDNLQRAGLIDHTESIKHQEGAQLPTKYYVINETGLEWLFEHQENVDDAVGRKRYLDSLDRLREIITDVRADVRDLADDLEALEAAREEAVANRIEDIEEQLDSLESKIREEEKDRKAAIQQLEDNLDRLDHVEARAVNLESELEGVDLQEFAARLDRLEAESARRDEELDELWLRVGYNARELLDLNLPKLLSGGPDPTEPGENGPPQRHKFT